MSVIAKTSHPYYSSRGLVTSWRECSGGALEVGFGGLSPVRIHIPIEAFDILYKNACKTGAMLDLTNAGIAELERMYGEEGDPLPEVEKSKNIIASFVIAEMEHGTRQSRNMVSHWGAAHSNKNGQTCVYVISPNTSGAPENLNRTVDMPPEAFDYLYQTVRQAGEWLDLSEEGIDCIEEEYANQSGVFEKYDFGAHAA